MKRFHKRAAFLVAVLLVWAILISARLFFYTVYARDYYYQMGNRQAWRKGVLLPLRGRILDRDNVPLAWSELYFDLYCYRAPDGKPDDKTKQLLETLLRNCVYQTDSDNKRCLIRRDLSPLECQNLSKHLDSLPYCRIEKRVKRRLVDYPKVRVRLGTTAINQDGVQVGASGMEAEYNRLLTGEAGEYVVMLDRYGNWIQGTWKMTKEPVNGLDVKLTQAVGEIIEKEDDKQ